MSKKSATDFDGTPPASSYSISRLIGTHPSFYRKRLSFHHLFSCSLPLHLTHPSKFSEWRKNQVLLGAALSALGMGEQGTLSSVCNQLGTQMYAVGEGEEAVTFSLFLVILLLCIIVFIFLCLISSLLYVLTTLLLVKSKKLVEWGAFEQPIELWMQSHMTGAQEARARYDKARKTPESGEVPEAEAAVLLKLREIEERKQFDVVDMCCDMVDAHIQYLTQVYILSPLPPSWPYPNRTN